VILVGATTENPSFAVNAGAALSRAVFKMEPAERRRAGIARFARGVPTVVSVAEGHRAPDALDANAEHAHGDARRALDVSSWRRVMRTRGRRLIDARSSRVRSHLPACATDKAVRSTTTSSARSSSRWRSDPDASVYYLLRMLEAGEGSTFRLAAHDHLRSEDVGTADPQRSRSRSRRTPAFAGWHA